MEIEVLGRHALLFDDDALLSFVNSSSALVEWNSLQIDRYDVRHLLSSPPPPRLRRRPPPSAASSDPHLDLERYRDLPPPSQPEVEENDESVDASGYRAVAFSYGDDLELANRRNLDEENKCPGFRPSFPVPEFLLKSMPSTEKIHQIIARTALFVSKNGGQSEIILRVKQGDNPTFGFLMPDHHLHAYFRFLVDHPEHVHSDTDANLQDENKEDNGNKKSDTVGGALSLLGSVYDSGEEEDATEGDPDSSMILDGRKVNSVSSVVSQTVDKPEIIPGASDNDEASTKHSVSSQKGKPSIIKKNPSVNTFRAESSTSIKKVDRSSSCPPTTDKVKDSSIGPISRAEYLIVEPPSDMKRTVEKIVDFIVKNGKQFETTLIEQDRKHGRFPFLLQSNLYHPYYSAVLQKAQESKQSGKSSICGKDDSVVVRERKSFNVLPNDSASITSGDSDVPFESGRKEKFKMVIGKLKKDGQEPPSKVTSHEPGMCIDAEAAAVILQAAARGIKNPEIGIVSSTTLNFKPIDTSSEGPNSNSKSKASVQKIDQNGLCTSNPTAEISAESAEATREAWGAPLTKQQKLKAERLRRAKMFVSMLKDGTPGIADPVRGSSVEPQVSPALGTGTEVQLPGKEREGNSVGVSEENEILDKNLFSDEHNERRSKRKYRSKSGWCDGEDYDDDADKNHHPSTEDGGVEDGEERGHKHSKRKKHRSHHSRSHRSIHSEKDFEGGVEVKGHKHSKSKHHARRSSEEDNNSDGDDSDYHHKSSRRKNSSHPSSYEAEEASSDKEREHRKKRHSSRRSRDDRRHTRRHSRRDEQSSPEHKHDSFPENQSHGEVVRETNSTDLEEGEIASKLSDQSRETVDDRANCEASLGVSSSHQTVTSQPSDPSDDLRAKIRAMLMATR